MDFFLKGFFDFLYPPRCPGCGRDVNREGMWCHRCFAYLSQPRQLSLSKESYLTACYSLALYERGLRKVLQDIKFNDKEKKEIVLSPFFNAFFESKYVTGLSDIDCVVPVPISKEKKKKRGFNQVDLIFKKRLVKRGFHWSPCLKKVSGTVPMWGLSLEERKENIKNAFYCTNTDIIKGKIILLVDDIFTTGSTLEEGARILKDKGAKKIKALTVASRALPLLED